MSDEQMSYLECTISDMETKIDDLEFDNGLLKKQNEILREAVRVSINQLRGVFVAIDTHGQNINTEFFIYKYEQIAKEKEELLEKLKDLE